MNDSLASTLKAPDRRSIVLGGGASIIGLMIGSPSMASVSAPRSEQNRASATTAGSGLYAFPGQAGDTSVIAVTWQEPYTRRVEQTFSEINIHTGFHDLIVKIRDDGAATIQGNLEGQRTFLGEIALRDEVPGSRGMALVIEAPSPQLASSPLQIWAEKKAGDGVRERIGSPFLASFLAEDAKFSKLYHSLSPGEDREVLRGPLERLLFLRAQASMDGRSAATFARRIARGLLPDVLRFDSSEPCGFTFAAQNGRYPTDQSTAVVDAIFTRAAAAKSADSNMFRRSFPYFSQSSRIV